MSPIARTALVTGANRGLGRAIAGCLAAQGHRVFLAARDPAAARTAAASLSGDVRPVTLDVTDHASVAAAAEATGPVDILVNNAGVLLDAQYDPLSVPADVVGTTFAVNTLGAWRVSQRYLPAMVERGWGRVVMVSSGTGAFSHGLHAGTPAYAVSKAALNAVTVLLASAVAGTGVLVNAVNPGRVRTAMMPGATTAPEDAAPDVVWAATLPDDGPTGTFLRGRAPVAW
jgi:NAD(P)-dependent dehydrogenase (short-subunit alcohol dehydrogenase family)